MPKHLSPRSHRLSRSVSTRSIITLALRNTRKSASGQDPLASIRRHRAGLLVALDQTGVLKRPVVSRVGTHTIDSYMAFMRSDAFMNSWDIATACGLDPMFDPAMVALIVDDDGKRGHGPVASTRSLRGCTRRPRRRRRSRVPGRTHRS